MVFDVHARSALSLQRLRAGLEELNFVSDLDTRKSRDEQRSMLRCQAQPVWDVQCVFLR